MKLYATTYVNPEEKAPRPTRRRFFGTQGDARVGVREMRAKFGHVNVDKFEPVEVPTKKDELLLWLNSNAALVEE